MRRIHPHASPTRHLPEEPLQRVVDNLGTGAGAVVGGDKPATDEQRHRHQASGFGVIRALAELRVQPTQVFRPAVIDLAQSRTDTFVTARPGLYAQFCEGPDDAEARCLMTMALFVGSRFIAADHGARSRAEVVNHALQRLLR
jgi:hypothetical protein